MSNAEAVGRMNREEGKAFETRVADLYRLLGYKVEGPRQFSGREVDLFLIRRIGDLEVHRAIECKAGPVRVEQVDEFIAKLRLVRRDFPSAIGTIVSGVSFTPSVTAHAGAEGIQLTLARDLAAQLIDGHTYTTNLLRETASDERYPLARYIEPLVGSETNGPAAQAFEVIDAWLHDPEWNQLTLLGDVGTGKSFLSRVVARRLATAFETDHLQNPLPVLIDLRHADREMSLEGLIITHLTRSGIGDASFPAFQYALSQGNIVLILDGFDEMASRITPQVTARNFNELARAVSGRAKVLLTCRTHYFRSRSEAEEVILGSTNEDQAASQLYWDLIARRGFRIAYLRPFDLGQIDAYVKLASPANAEDVSKRIRKTYNLLELSQRPMLLDMIVKSIDALRAGTVNPASLYTVFTDAWIRRDVWRPVLTAEAKLAFVTGLAKTLWYTDREAVHYSALIEYVQREFASLITNPRELFEIDSEVRTATFLTRNESGEYGFAHKSYAEFFLARHAAADLSAGRTECLDTRRFGPDTVSFIAQMTKESVEQLLTNVLTADYRARVSENALVCLYGMRRERVLGALAEELAGDDYEVPLPAEMRLDRAELSAVTLERAVMPLAHLAGARLTNTIFTRARLEGSDFEGATIGNGDFTGAWLARARFTGANLNGCNFDGADLTAAVLRDVDLRSAFTGHWNVDRADLHGAVLMAIDQAPELPGGLGEQEFGELIATVRAAASRWIPPSLDRDDLVDAAIFSLTRSEFIKRISAIEPLARWRYIETAVRNQLIDLRRRTRHDHVPLDALDYELVDGQPSVVDELIKQERELHVDRAMHRLAPEVQDVIRARYLEGMSVHDIARTLHMSQSSVYNRLRAGMRQLRQFVDDEATP